MIHSLKRKEQSRYDDKKDSDKHHDTNLMSGHEETATTEPVVAWETLILSSCHDWGVFCYHLERGDVTTRPLLTWHVLDK